MIGIPRIQTTVIFICFIDVLKYVDAYITHNLLEVASWLVVFFLCALHHVDEFDHKTGLKC